MFRKTQWVKNTVSDLRWPISLWITRQIHTPLLELAMLELNWGQNHYCAIYLSQTHIYKQMSRTRVHVLNHALTHSTLLSTKATLAEIVHVVSRPHFLLLRCGRVCYYDYHYSIITNVTTCLKSTCSAMCRKRSFDIFVVYYSFSLNIDIITTKGRNNVEWL